jgi:hypothetical protein
MKEDHSMQKALRLVEGEPDQLAVIMTTRAKADADRLGLDTSLADVVDEIELALSIEQSEIEDARRLRGLAKLREAAARQYAIRIGRLLRLAKADVPHGQWQDWVERNFSGKAASEYMRIARTRKRRAGRMNYAIPPDFERAQVEEARLYGDDPGTPEEREVARKAFAALTQSLRRPTLSGQVLKRRF